jgi:type IV secretion system protein TrbL
VLLVAGVCASGAAAPPAEAFNPLKPVCAVGGLVSGLLGKACTVVSHAGNIVKAGKKLAGGHVGGAFKALVGGGGSSVASKATFALGLAAVVTWVLGGARYALHETASVIGRTTAPQLRSTWFSATYWRVAGIAAVLTLPFLFAAAIQALIHSDLALLMRSAFGYLPLAMLAVSIAAPLTMLLLSASDQLSAVVSSAAGNASGHFLATAGRDIGALAILSRSPFLVFVTGLLTVGGALALWFELMLRAAAVYVIVLMLPLAFAALVWPARRIWAIRAVELLVALILSKFVIVAVLSLGGAALSQGSLSSVSGMLAGFVLLVMGALAPWALLRLLPLSELASGAVGSLRGDAIGAGGRLLATTGTADDWAGTAAEMRRQAEDPAGLGADDVPRPPVDPPPEPEPLPGGAGITGASGQPSEPSPSSAPAGANGAVPASGTEGGQQEAFAATAPSASNDQPERSPGLGPIWQMDDFSWPTLTLGPQDGRPPPPVGAEAGTADGHNGAAPEEATGLGEGDPMTPRSHEDHDPTPPPQDPEHGHL